MCSLACAFGLRDPSRIRFIGPDLLEFCCVFMNFVKPGSIGRVKTPESFGDLYRRTYFVNRSARRCLSAGDQPNENLFPEKFCQAANALSSEGLPAVQSFDT